MSERTWLSRDTNVPSTTLRGLGSETVDLRRDEVAGATSSHDGNRVDDEIVSRRGRTVETVFAFEKETVVSSLEE